MEQRVAGTGNTMGIEVRPAGAGAPNISAVEVRAVQGSRNADLQLTNPMPTEYDACRMLTKEGKPCRGKPINGGPFCFSHVQLAG